MDRRLKTMTFSGFYVDWYLNPTALDREYSVVYGPCEPLLTV